VTEPARVCYMMNRYPSVSHTFIQREIDAVRAAGVEVVPVALVRAAATDVLSEADRRAREETATIRPVSVPLLWRAVVVSLLRYPGAFVATLFQGVRAARTDVRDGLWSVFYFVEALILWHHCQRNRVRHIHAHFASAPSDLAWLAASFGNRVRDDGEPPWSWSMTVHGWHEFVAERKHSLGAKAAAADFVICISEYTRSQLMRQVDPTVWPRLHVRHCGIDPDMFSPAKPGAAMPGSVLCVGRLDAEKGHLVLVDALAALRSRGLDATAVFVGDGPLRPVIEERIGALGLGHAVHLAGAIGQDEITDYYRRASAFCLPTFIEGLPVVLMEAMACGLPVVTTPVNGIPELVQDGVTGLLVAPGRPDLLADALQRLLVDPSVGAELAHAGRERVIAEFDIRRIGPSIAALFEAATGARATSSRSR
jgi:colanic acid/amylovoran biosynthesis glycosyltransferase